METMLYVWLSVLLVERWLVAGSRSSVTAARQRPAIGHWWVLGILGGLLALTRPEGLGLIGLIGLAGGWRLRHVPGRLARIWLATGIGLAIPVVPYLAFHYLTTGYPFPNTFYAKQEEYRLLLTLFSPGRRWLMMAGVTLVGGQVLLIPGFVYAVLDSASRFDPSASTDRDRQGGHAVYGVLLAAAWYFIHLALYALRLPVTYQHGRYQMPVIPFFVLVGVGGTALFLQDRSHTMALRVLSRALLVSIVLILLAFLGLGARAYAADVAFIQGEMVAIAHWLEANVSPDSLIAVHDIGAIGYYTPRPVLDLAGLVTPEVIPFITDEERLIEFMQAHGADYVVFFPDWSDAYRRMAQDPRLEPVYATGFEWTLRQDRANMTVFRLLPR
jgi:hypothetical protein